jgi:hypothetical protein
LSLLDLDARTHRDIGFFRIESFSRHASEIGWLVFGGGRVAMLDTASLIAAAASGGGPIEHHWTVPLTEPGQILAFADRPATAMFLFHRAQGGLVELWALTKATLQVTCSFLLLGDHKPVPAVQSYGWQGGPWFAARAGTGEQMAALALSVESYTLEGERRILAERKAWLQPGQTIAGSDMGTRTLYWCTEAVGAPAGSVPATRRDAAEKGVVWYGALSHVPGRIFTARFPGAARLAMRTTAASAQAAICDDLGRILVVDLERDAVLFRNDAR